MLGFVPETDKGKRENPGLNKEILLRMQLLLIARKGTPEFKNSRVHCSEITSCSAKLQT